MKHLFIGGCKDGQWLDVDEALPLTVLTIDYTVFHGVHEEYTRVDLGCEGSITTVYVTTHLAKEDIVKLLLEGYKK